MHWANLRLADCCLGVRLLDNVPGGCRSLHAVVACFHTAGLTLTPYWKSFLASGSGKSATPCARLHAANFTALSCAESVVSWEPPFPEDALEPQPAPPRAHTTATASVRLIAASSDPASGRRTWPG